jgi:hypothetical protein
MEMLAMYGVNQNEYNYMAFDGVVKREKSL